MIAEANTIQNLLRRDAAERRRRIVAAERLDWRSTLLFTFLALVTGLFKTRPDDFTNDAAGYREASTTRSSAQAVAAELSDSGTRDKTAGQSFFTPIGSEHVRLFGERIRVRGLQM